MLIHPVGPVMVFEGLEIKKINAYTPKRAGSSCGYSVSTVSGPAPPGCELQY